MTNDGLTRVNVRPAGILMVCTGNICRSPYAERLAAGFLPPDAVRVSSAGTGAVVGADMEPEARDLLPDGLRSVPHRAQLIDEQHIMSSDLVLTMTKQQRADVVKLVPKSVRRVFTLREAARLVMSAPSVPNFTTVADATRDVADFLSSVRGTVGASTPDDVADPYRKGPAAYAVMRAEMDPALAVLVRYLTGQLVRPQDGQFV